jgi:hypothetical protein
MDGNCDGVPVGIAIVKNHVGRISGSADREARNFPDFLAVDEEQAVPFFAGDGFVEDGVVKHAIRTDGWRGSRMFGFTGQERVLSGRV